MSSRVRKQSSQKLFPMKATLPLNSICPSFSSKVKSPENNLPYDLRRTASLDALYMRPWSLIPACTIQLDKATQTDESYYFDRTNRNDFSRSETPDMKIEKVIRQRLQRTQRGGEHSVSSQTLSPVHATALPLQIPRTCPPSHMRPMRSSVEGLNQEIEKLVLIPGQQHSCRPETTSMFSRGSTTPENPLCDLLHDTRSVNTQTPISDESQSTSSPEECASNASPRINRFLAREPPDGCERVNLKSTTDTDQTTTTTTTHFKPCIGFQLKPSLGSAFKLLQPIPILQTTDDDKNDNEN